MKFAVLLACTVLAAPVMAQQSPAPSGTEKPKKDKNDPDRVICRRTGQTGSILGGKPECHTKAQWEAISERSRDALQNRRPNLGGAPAN